MVQTGQVLVVPDVDKHRLHGANALAVELPAPWGINRLAHVLTRMTRIFGLGLKVGHLVGHWAARLAGRGVVVIESEDAVNRSDRRRANSTNPLRRSIGNDHGNGMEPCRAVRIWGRAASSATSPPVDVQSVPSFLYASNHANAGIPLIKEENRKPENRCLTIWEVPIKG